MNYNSEIFKIHQLDSNGILKRIFVFQGSFSDSEYVTNDENNVETIISKQLIHKDDSIRIIKKKIMKEFVENSISYNELYLFSRSHINNFSILNAYKQITHNEKYKLTNQILAQFLVNIDEELIEELSEYKYENLSYIKSERDCKVILGQKFEKHIDNLFSVNPYDVLFTFDWLTNSTNNNLQSFENDLLFNYGNTKDNIIYICLAEDVFQYAIDNNFEQKYFSQLYFPFLYKNGIKNKLDLIQEKSNLIKENEKIMEENDFKLYDTIDTFYNMYYNRKQELTYIERGIKYFKFNIKTDFKNQLPLEIIFKNIHATKIVPFIKYNPGFKRDNIFRLYSEQRSKNGNKIPYLSESTITRLSREIGKSKQIALYIQSFLNGSPIDIYMSFELNGNIIISSKLNSPMPIEQINNIIKESIKPIIDNINNIIQQSGHKIRDFTTLYDDFIEIININYSSTVEIQNDGQISLKSIIGCISSIFDIFSDNIYSGAKLRYKRVENFREMDAQSELIYEIYKNSENKGDVVTALMQNYNMSQDDAIKRFGQYISDYQQINEKFIDNPGFPVKMKINSLDKKMYVEFEKIISINYLESIEIFIDSIVKILQKKTDDFTNHVNKLCKSTIIYKDVDKSHVKNVVDVIDRPKPQAFGIINLQDIFGDKKEDELEEDNEEKEENLDENEEEVIEEELYDPFLDIEGINESTNESNSLINTSLEEKKENEEIVQESKVSNTEEEDDEYDPFLDIEEEEEEDEIKGGEITSSNIDGTSLTHPNPFQKKLEESDPILFSVRQNKNFKSYTQFCQSSARKQPIIMTDEEKEEVDNQDVINGSNSYVKESAMRYGSDPKKQFWYICPRYYCLLTKRPISKEEVDKGTCGKIISQKDSKIRPGHYVYEFNNPTQHIDDNGNYIQHHPGFGKDPTPEGFGVPCCFKKWDSKVQLELRNRFLSKKEVEKATDKINLYIVSPTKYPIPKSRWGFLPPSVEYFLQINSNSFISDENKAMIRQNTPSLLRYGVENSNTQSFVACMADIYAYQNLLKEIPSIDRMRSILVESLTLDLFIKYHNGSLVSIFKSDNKESLSFVEIDNYKNTEFYKSLDLNNISQYNFLLSTISAFDNFINYLSDNESYIDHTYLWDIVSSENPKLMKNGLNLIIIEITNKDTTDNIELLCPTNAYSNSFYDPNKGTLLLLKQDDFYEPIYLYENKDGNIFLTKMFFENKIVFKNMKKVIKMIQKIQKDKCSPKSVYPREYEFKRNINAIDLMYLLENYDYDILSQVSNYQSKIIGFIVEKNKKNRVFLPCFPSAIIRNIKIDYMENPELWTDYRSTVDNLRFIYNDSERKIRCNPIMKVIEDELIIGIITETNQFVEIREPVQDIYDDRLIPIKNTNYIIADKIITTSRTEDENRSKIVQNIMLENQFFTLFRSTLRLLLNDYENRKHKKDIINALNNPNYIYKRKIIIVEKLIKNLMKDFVIFGNYSEETLKKIKNIKNCINENTENCSEDGKLIIPKINLINKIDNEKIYYGRVTDELIRYRRIRMFMLHSTSYLNISDIEYKVNENEFIILQSYLTPEYFENLKVLGDKKYIKTTNYEMANPNTKRLFSNEVTLNEQFESLNDIEQQLSADLECIQEIKAVIGNDRSYWKRIFPKNAKEIFFKSGGNCDFQMIIYIIKDLYKRDYTVLNIKQALVKFYEEPMKVYSQKIKEILKTQLKFSILKPFLDNKINIETLIMNELYTLTDFDIWLLATNLNIPIILFSIHNLKLIPNREQEVKWLLMNKNYKEAFYYIRSPMNLLEGDKKTTYSLIKRYTLSELREDFEKDVLNAITNKTDNVQSLDGFLQTF